MTSKKISKQDREYARAFAASVAGRFSRINQPVTCASCGVRTTTRVRGSVGTDLCGPCYDAAGLENSHFDGHHEGSPVAGCKHCTAEAASK